jgi:hypothetical protein
MFVQVLIEGRVLPDVVAVPRHALHPEREVWLVEEGRLRTRQVDVVRQDRDAVYARGLEDGEVLITSPLDVVTEGMAVRTWLGGDGEGENEADLADRSSPQVETAQP